MIPGTFHNFTISCFYIAIIISVLYCKYIQLNSGILHLVSHIVDLDAEMYQSYSLRMAL